MTLLRLSCSVSLCVCVHSWCSIELNDSLSLLLVRRCSFVARVVVVCLFVRCRCGSLVVQACMHQSINPSTKQPLREPERRMSLCWLPHHDPDRTCENPGIHRTVRPPVCLSVRSIQDFRIQTLQNNRIHNGKECATTDCQSLAVLSNDQHFDCFVNSVVYTHPSFCPPTH